MTWRNEEPSGIGHGARSQNPEFRRITRGLQEYWNTGMMEGWVKCNQEEYPAVVMFYPLFQYSTVPIFHRPLLTTSVWCLVPS